MKSALIALILALGSLVSSALALEVGEKAKCIVLTQVQPKGAPDTSGCIRDVIDPKHRYTLIEFFSIHCSYCDENLPILAKLHAEISDVATLRQVSVDRKEAEVREHIKKNAALVNFPVALDLERNATRAYGVRSTPMLFVLDRENTVRFKVDDVLTPAQVQAIKDLVRH